MNSSVPMSSTGSKKDDVIGPWGERFLCHYHENKRLRFGMVQQQQQQQLQLQRSIHSTASKSRCPPPATTRLCARKILETEGFQFSANCKLGNGRYSKVVQAVDIRASRKVAIKVIDLSDRNVTEEFRDKFLPREIQCWKRIKNPNNVFLYREFARDNYQFCVMELSDFGDLLSYVQKNGAVPEVLARHWLVQIINGIRYLHSRGIAHRDLKMENVLLFEGSIVKLCDYGFCKQSVDLSETYCGSKSYSAPEILKGTPYDIFKADIWSLGVVGFVMLTNSMPFRENVEHNSMIVEAQKHRQYKYSPGLKLSSACRSSIDAMMTYVPMYRPNIQQCCGLPWFLPQPSGSYALRPRQAHQQFHRR